MSLSLFIAKKIYTNKDDQQRVSRPVVTIATLGVAVGLAVMIITVSVVLGFKHTIRDKVVGFGNHIQIANFLTLQNAGQSPLCFDDSIKSAIKGIDHIKHIQPYSIVQGILKTENDFKGINFKGIDQHYDTSFLAGNLIAGEIPAFSDSASSGKILISNTTARKLLLKSGDKIYAYFVSSDDVRARRFVISGIYETNLSQFDESLCFIDIYTANRLNGWSKELCTGAEVILDNFNQLDHVNNTIVNTINRTKDRLGNTIGSATIHEMHPQIFTWLELLDLNVWIILALMVCVAGFTMISGLLIIILERTQFIGTLKALGACNTSIRHIFLWYAAFIIGKGLLIGNILGVGLVLLQTHTGFISLDPTNYYVSTAPMELNLPLVILLNISTLLICIIVLILPSFLISHINPAKSIRYE